MKRHYERIFTEEEKQFVKDNIDSMTIAEICVHLKCASATYYKAFGKNKTARYRPSKKEKQFVRDNPEMSKIELRNRLNLTQRKVNFLIKQVTRDIERENEKKAPPPEVYYDMDWSKRARKRCEAMRNAAARRKTS